MVMGMDYESDNTSGLTRVDPTNQQQQQHEQQQLKFLRHRNNNNNKSNNIVSTSASTTTKPPSTTLERPDDDEEQQQQEEEEEGLQRRRRQPGLRRRRYGRYCLYPRLRLSWTVLLSVVGCSFIIIRIVQYLSKTVGRLYQSYIDETYPSPFLPGSQNMLQTKIRGRTPVGFTFPSPEERVRFYMGQHWYNYYNQYYSELDNITSSSTTTTTISGAINNVNVSTTFTPADYNSSGNRNNKDYKDDLSPLWETSVCTDIPFWTYGMGERGSPYRFNGQNLQQLIYVDWPKRLPWRYDRGHPADAYRYHFALVDDSPNNRNNNNNNNNKQMLLQFGDGKDSATFLSTPYPIMVKTRLAPNIYKERFGDEGSTPSSLLPSIMTPQQQQQQQKQPISPTINVDESKTMSTIGQSSQHPYRNNNDMNGNNNNDIGDVHNTYYPHYPPIIGMFEIHRHYNDNFQRVDDLWDIIPWSTKKETLIWRGASSGKRRTVVEQYFDQYDDTKSTTAATHTTTSSTMAQQQQQKHAANTNTHTINGTTGYTATTTTGGATTPSSTTDNDVAGTMIDIAFSYTLDIHKDRLDHLVRGGPMSVKDLLSYKYLLSLEGWCMASGLKWMLYSNSVVFMAPPTKVSWAMESILRPFVHYVPVYSNYSNLLDMVRWARTHDAECEQISLQARDYMERLVTSEQAQHDTAYILQEMDRIYQNNFGRTLQRCSGG